MNGDCGVLLATPEVLEFDEVNPSAGAVSSKVSFVNSGTATVALSRFSIDAADQSCGEFTVAENFSNEELSPGESLEVTVVFTPEAGAEPECACHAAGALRAHVVSAANCDADDVALVAGGPCPHPLRCDAEKLDFSDAYVDSSYEAQVTCFNLNVAGETVEDIRLAEKSSSAFVLAVSDDIALPLSLALAEEITFVVTYDPTETGEDEGEVSIVLESGEEMTIPLAGNADRERPDCSETLPTHPEPVLETDEYIITLETDEPSFYPGVVRSQTFYSDQPPLISDILVTSGTFSDPECEVWQTGHQYHWKGCDPEGGTINNIHAIPHSDDIDLRVRNLEVWDEITVVGYEVDRVDYSDGSWWTDMGCNTLVITWICDGEL